MCAGQDPQFTVQVETVSFEPAARAVVNRLNSRGYDAYFESLAVTNEKVLYKVRFGRFATREEAVAATKAYKKHEQRDCFVVQTMLTAGSARRTTAARPAESSSFVGAQAHENGKEFYTVQIAAKANKAVAQKFADRLHRKGYPAYLRGPVVGDAKPLYRIRFGSYETRAQAEKAGRMYAERERGEYLVVLSPAERPQSALAAGPVVAVLAPAEPVAVAGHFYTVQVCVRETTRAAESYADRVRAKGFEPYIATHETSKGKMLYRVRMGKFKERSRAMELARDYEQKGGRDFLVVRTERNSVSPNGHESSAQPPVLKPLVPAMVEQALSQEFKPVQEIAVVESESAFDRAAQQGRFAEGTVSARSVKGVGQAGSVAEPSPESPAGQSVTVTKIYAYTGPGNELNLTNAHAKIPKELLARIQYVSIFPVMLVDVPEKGSALVMEIEDARRLLALSGLRLPEENRTVVSAGIQEVLSAEPLRLKYSPGDDHKDILTGTLYYRSGADLQIELLKRGLALVDEASLPVARQALLRAAQQRAKGLKVGIWATQTP